MSSTFQGFSAKHQAKLESIAEQAIVSQEPLSHETHRDVLFVPHSYLGQGMAGACLYDNEGHRIELSCVYRGGKESKHRVTQTPLTLELRQFSAQRRRDKFIYMGSLFNHYGHFLTEMISRTWFLIENLEMLDEYKVLYHGLPTLRWPSYIKDFFVNLGLDAGKFITFRTPHKIDEVIIPQPSFCNRFFANQRHCLSPEKIARKIVESSQISASQQPLYLSRSKLTKNKQVGSAEAEVENFLREKNCKIQHPQCLSLVEQVQLINQHQLIIGAIGSALHNSLFNISAPQKIVYLSAFPINANFLLINCAKQESGLYVKCMDKQVQQALNQPKRRSVTMDSQKAIQFLKEII